MRRRPHLPTDRRVVPTTRTPTMPGRANHASARRCAASAAMVDRDCPARALPGRPPRQHSAPPARQCPSTIAACEPLFRAGCVAIPSAIMPRGDLFPEIGPFETGYLPLSSNHVMYWEQVGSPRGRPVLFLHGGPGAGAG